MNAHELQQAFLVFDDASRQLADSYNDLQNEVARLSAEVVTANARLREQLREKNVMTTALARSQRLAAMGAMTASLAHQLRTPLASALLYASQLSQPVIPPAEQARFAGEVVSRLRELESFIQGTLAFVSGRVELREDVDLARIVADAQRLAAPQMTGAGVALDVDVVDGRLPLRASREALLSMLLNLLDNAQRACVAGNRVRLVLQRSGTDAVLCVADDGCGMTADTRARLFEPYFTTRSDGHGLGLAFARSVVEAHGGRIAVDTAEGRGTQFTVSLPLAHTWHED